MQFVYEEADHFLDRDPTTWDVQIVSIQGAIAEALEHREDVQMMSRRQTLLVLSRIVLPPKNAAIIESRTFCYSIGICKRSEPVLVVLFNGRESLAKIQVVLAPDRDAHSLIVLAESDQHSDRGSTNLGKRGLGDGLVEQVV